jgi:[ribosomal protein S18]-alanine N-acetyltransferase
VNNTAAEHHVRARLGPWPYDREVAHLVLLDHHMVPDVDDVRSWIAQARSQGARALRTGALFPPSTPAFTAQGFDAIDELRLLELTVGSERPGERTGVRVRRLGASQIEAAAAVDRRAFPSPWANDGPALVDIIRATPRSRARCVLVEGRLVAFSISGQAASTGYVQRLAVDPDVRRRGLARRLLADAVDWMRRRDIERVLVNTATDNLAALALYRSFGFVERPEPLTILERTLTDR